MTDTILGRAAEPDGAPRLAALDVLRGIAILGILFMNINDMGASIYASFDDPRHIGWTRPDRIAWWLREVLANGTARCLLEMLFGVGMVILTDRTAQAAGTGAVMRRYYARNLVLLTFGLVHLFILLWPGDILHTYALAALIVFWCRRWPPRFLLMAGLSLALLQLAGGGYGYHRVNADRAAFAEVQAKQAAGRPLTRADAAVLKTGTDRATQRGKGRADLIAKIAAEDAARTGGFVSWAAAAWANAAEQGGLEAMFVLEAAATMLVGAALYRWGIIQGWRSRRFYVGMTIPAYAGGLGLRAVAAFADMRFDGLPTIGWATDEIARLATTLGHIGLVHLLMASGAGGRALRPFEAAGRTALSIYVAQTMICLWVIYPPFGLGLYGTQGWAAMMATAFVINAALLVMANWWVGRFSVAPVEWAWRSLAEGRRLPFGRMTTGPGAIPPPA